MNKNIILSSAASMIILLSAAGNSRAQCHYIPSTSTSVDTLSYSFIGGSFASFGCSPIDPTFWLSGSGVSVTVTFVNPESFPSFRVWGMNDDDSASVSINGAAYPLTSSSAFYDAKVVCGLSPGLDGVIFSGGNLVGANSNATGNYSYQNITINNSMVTSIMVTGLSGAGWGFAGVTVDCPVSVHHETAEKNILTIIPNPAKDIILIHGTKTGVSEITVMNDSGMVVKKKVAINNSLDISDLSAGLYLILVSSGNNIITERIVKI